MKLSDLVSRIVKAESGGICAVCQQRPVRGAGLLRCTGCFEAGCTAAETIQRLHGEVIQ